ncbi:hypothetical protein JG687_00012397 [Phytophthora cactorum]|uniref:Uncharacterized protein n=1 Tax=Phytophthora cactorum TaxID=29920 RepID=A0A8T1U377_9STRA|nr:hypothetical protein PC120_g6376 [Phytophthora cactorum]KAG3072222.1 hypothetical protein PC121_g9021 [Phytophthora cactorum]KAG4058218.1 hypothetical protein PC123_g6823 [Phytophthora cactorum]KAG6953453.1 hypothetical protein JG687_00012397 [Phytophthora cactorum]
MAEPTKRKNFSEAEDVMLLKQTIADEPYKQEHGKVMEQWEKLAYALVANPDFSHKNLIAETAQNRVNAHIAAANKKNTAAKRLSGVTESHSEKDQLLDELILRMDECKAETMAKKKLKNEQTIASEDAGETIRCIAVKRLKHSREEADGIANDIPSRNN